MKILFLHDHPEIQGGATLYVRAIRSHMERRGHRCVTVGFPEDGLHGDDFVAVPRKAWGGTRKKIHRKLDWDPFLFGALRRAVLSHKPDLIHIHNYASIGNLVPAACHGFPTVLTVHDLALCCPLSGGARDRNGQLCHGTFGVACRRRGCFSSRVFLEQLLLRESAKRLLLQRVVSRVYAHSTWLAERLRGMGLSVTLLPHHVPTDRFPFRPHPGDTPDILFVGYLDETKGVGQLLEVFRRVRAKVPRARLHIVGTGPEAPLYRRMAFDLADHVRFHGEVSHDEVAGFYQRAAFTAIPSRIPETGPFTALESMSTGRAVVGTRLGGLAEIVQEGETGYLLDPEDLQGMASRMVHLLEHPDFASAMGARGREEIDRMSGADPFARVEEDYGLLLQPSGRRLRPVAGGRQGCGGKHRDGESR